MGATNIPKECLWHDGWPVLGYVGIELAQSSEECINVIIIWKWKKHFSLAKSTYMMNFCADGFSKNVSNIIHI